MNEEQIKELCKAADEYANNVEPNYEGKYYHPMALDDAFIAGANYGVDLCTPKWITVKSEADIPDDNVEYWVENHDGIVEVRHGYSMSVKNTRRYTKVIVPQPPKQ